MLRLYNTLTRKKEIFKPLERGLVKIYTCGPTVYDYAHIGNFRAYVCQDILRRYLKYKGFKVKQVMNLTDVDDKTIRGARREGISLSEYTERYVKAFFEDIKALNIEPVEFYPRATEHIRDMVSLIKKLLEKGYAYRGRDGSIYFDISKFEDYGKLAGIDVKKLKPGARVKADEYAKEEARDFALWKAYTKEDGDVFWDTEIGKGRPGWHLECSTMSMKYLGETLDIHAGGVDLVFPHHENEIAQSEAATGKKFVSYWFHNEHLLVDNRKMSKSLGNFYTLRDLLNQGHDPKAIRYLLLSTHYRQKLNFTFRGLEMARETVNGLIDFMGRLKETKPRGEWNEELHRKALEAKQKFEEYMDDDLDIRQALAVIFTLVRETNKAIDSGRVSRENLDEVYDIMRKFDGVLGILEEEEREIPEEWLLLIKEREKARANRDYAKADKIRAELFERGIILEDTPEGTRWKWRR
jgi:cysteinyl-tRNA synthetase